MREAVIVEAVRTPIARRNGKLKEMHPVVLGSLVLKEIIKRSGIAPELVDDVVFGCVTQVGEQSLNVARNALQAQGDRGRIVLRTRARSSVSIGSAIHRLVASVQVEDNGPGVPEADRSRVVERFVRLEQSRSEPGSGLGLSLASAVARLHGGELTLEDNHPGLKSVIALPRGGPLQSAG